MFAFVFFSEKAEIYFAYLLICYIIVIGTIQKNIDIEQ